jgi:hypothetical protein
MEHYFILNSTLLSIFTTTPHFKSFSSALICCWTQFFTSTSGTWKAHSCQNYSININSTLLRFVVFTFFTAQLFTYRLSNVSCILHLHRNTKFLKDFSGSKIFNSIHHIYNIQHYLSSEQLTLYASFKHSSHAIWSEHKWYTLKLK